MAKMTFTDATQASTVDITTIESNTGNTDFEVKVIDIVDKIGANIILQTEAVTVLDSIKAKQTVRAEAMAATSALTSTTVASITDLSSVDASSLLSVDDLDLDKYGLPNPADYGVKLEDMVDLSAIDASGWDLPKPTLATLNPDCFDLSDMYLSNLMDLSSIDMRGFKLPSVDFSWATDISLPAWMKDGAASIGDLFDLSSIDLSGIIDLTNVSIPDYLIPDSFNLDFDFDCSAEFAKLKSIFGSMGSSGDLLGLGNIAKYFNGIGCVGTTIMDICNPSSVIDAITNFDVPGLNDTIKGYIASAKSDLDDMIDNGEVYLSKISDALNIKGYQVPDSIRDIFESIDIDLPSYSSIFGYQGNDDLNGSILASLAYLGDEWWWLDKENKRYNYTVLSNTSEVVIRALSTDSKYNDVVHAYHGLSIV